MTDIQTIVKNGAYKANFWGLLCPNAMNTMGLWLPRQHSTTAISAQRSGWNLAPETLLPRQGEVVGSPTWGSGYGVFSNNVNYINTNVPEPSADMTLIIVGRTTASGADNANRPAAIGNFNGSGGCMIYLSAAGTVRGQAYDTGGNKFRVVSPTTGELAAWGMYSMTMSATSMVMYANTKGTSQAPLTITGHVAGTQPIQVGDVPSSLYTNGWDIAAAVVLNKALDSTELATWRTYLGARLSEFSITI